MTTDRRLPPSSRSGRRPSRARTSRIAVTSASVTAVLAMTLALGRTQPVDAQTAGATGTGGSSVAAAPSASGSGLAAPRTAPRVVQATPAPMITRRTSIVTRSGGSR